VVSPTQRPCQQDYWSGKCFLFLIYFFLCKKIIL
jgi:hypothetical protein